MSMGELDNISFSCSSLLCEETEACFSETGRQEEDGESQSVYLKCCDNEDYDEYIKKLVQRETDFGFKTNESFADYQNTSKSWLECARLDAIEWIFNTRKVFGFQIHTAYLSVIYFDRFLSKRSIDEGKLWAIRLLSVACLSLAAKMEECRVPPLSEFPIEDYHFENKVIQRMELLILSTLEWKMGSVTPFAYLHYFIHKLYAESNSNKELVSNAIELIMAMAKEISLVNQYRPSIIAAAAVFAASGNPLTSKAMEVKIDSISLWGSLENEQIVCCYKMMQELQMRKSKTPNFVVTSHFSAIHALENASAKTAGAAGTKRKLTFNQSDQNGLAKKICRSE
ncbi:hypothetical protein CCACVL1_26514 [Corchorus capsularis]|uniref:Uncharacterized protein n=1 Tax=Corchorus capsularis TaxID=210143 RepID=A0A1R3GEP5_COCAP|nr:hypothetical protein CCACVL1_26514 [Corchorus capsularis]